MREKHRQISFSFFFALYDTKARYERRRGQRNNNNNNNNNNKSARIQEIINLSRPTSNPNPNALPNEGEEWAARHSARKRERERKISFNAQRTALVVGFKLYATDGLFHLCFLHISLASANVLYALTHMPNFSYIMLLYSTYKTIHMYMCSCVLVLVMLKLLTAPQQQQQQQRPRISALDPSVPLPRSNSSRNPPSHHHRLRCSVIPTQSYLPFPLNSLVSWNTSHCSSNTFRNFPH
eukprot:gene5862-4184_t